MDEQTLLETVTSHVELSVGPIRDLRHQLVSKDAHLDILHVAPTDEKRFHALVTCGMSLRPMSVPPRYEEFRFAELCLLLPPDWPLEQDDFGEETNYWPLRLLQVAASFPFEHATWLGRMHTLQNGSESSHTPYAADIGFSAVVLLPSLTLGPKFHKYQDLGRTIYFWCLYPLHWDELVFVRQEGDLLLDKFDKAGMSDIIDKGRPSVLEKRGWLRRR